MKYSRITGLGDDLCLALEAESVRIDRIPGKSTVGMEVPNDERATIVLRELLESPEYHTDVDSSCRLRWVKTSRARSSFPICRRCRICSPPDQPAPGKSVSINAMILSLLFRSRPDQVKLIMIDPKRLELGLYQDIPHLLVPVVTEPKIAQNALASGLSRKWKRATRSLQSAACEIWKHTTIRCRQLPIPGSATRPEGEDQDREPLPYIVIVIDELADLMMTAAARSGRVHHTSGADGARRRHSLDPRHAAAVGRRHHGTDQSELPCAHFVPRRIEGRLANDSRFQRRRTTARPRRHAVPASGFVAADARAWAAGHGGRGQRGRGFPEDTRQADLQREDPGIAGRTHRNSAMSNGEIDELYDDAVGSVLEMGKASTSALQRRLRIGYGRAASLLDAMERERHHRTARWKQASRRSDQQENELLLRDN